MDIVYQILLFLATTAIGWFFGKLQTKREQKQTDIQIIEGAISPMLNSIKELTEHSSELVAKLLTEQEKNLKLIETNLALLTEKTNLVNKIESLEKKVATLTDMVKKLANEKDSISSV